MPLLALSAVTVLLILVVLRRPGFTGDPSGKAIAFVAFFVLPGLVTAFGLNGHIERSKKTEFCLSCHIMEPYGKSLLADDSDSLPASHFQNRRIPREQACFTCHTTYTMFGDAKAKLKGLKHLYVNYLGTKPERPELYSPFNNRECLHCHEGMRSYEENDMHADDLKALSSGETSCLECHETIHDLDHLESKAVWKASLP